MPSNLKILRKNTYSNCFAKVDLYIYKLLCDKLSHYSSFKDAL